MTEQGDFMRFDDLAANQVNFILDPEVVEQPLDETAEVDSEENIDGA